MTDQHTPKGRSGRCASVALIVLAMLATACSGPESLPLTELVRRDGEFLHPVTMEPYSGVAVAAYADAPRHIERRASLRNGRYDGPFELFFENANLSVREVYREGQRDGPYEWYTENGRLYERGTYRNGLREGPYEAYFQDGQLHEKGTYRGGEFHGPREWYLDDRLLERVTYVNGQIDGPYERYSTDGTLMLRGMLLYGDPCGVWLEGTDRVIYPSCGLQSD
jgi:hypothetical protein